jgi:hypothetical protein
MGHKEVPVIHLRKMMLEELQRLKYSAETIRNVIVCRLRGMTICQLLILREAERGG